MSASNIEQSVKETLNEYFLNLKGTEPNNVYDMVLSVVEKPLIEIVMQQAYNNQSRAALWLGINRNTLRKKIAQYQIKDTIIANISKFPK